MALSLRLVLLFFGAAIVRAESSGYAFNGNGPRGPYEFIIQGVGERMPDGSYAQWHVMGRVNGVAVSRVISDSEFRSGYGAQGLLLKKSDLEAMKSSASPLDNVMNGGRSAGLAAAQRYADRVAPKEYQLPPSGNKGTVIIGGDAGTHALRSAQEIGVEMFRAMSARTAYERDQAASLGFDNVNKYKAFLGQNRSRILAAAKAGSADPVGDVLAERYASKSARAEVSMQSEPAANGEVVGAPVVVGPDVADQQQRYLNGNGMNTSVQHQASVWKSVQGLLERQQAREEAANPVIRVRRMRGALTNAIQSVVDKGEKVAAADFDPIISAIREVGQLQDSFRALTKAPQLRAEDAGLQDALTKHLAVIVSRRLPSSMPITQADVDAAFVVLDSLEAVAGMDLKY